MHWMKDSALFADIDENGRLTNDPFIAEVLAPLGQADKAVRTTVSFEYDVKEVKIGVAASKNDAPQPSFRRELADIRKYLETHSYIGVFPNPYKTRERCWVEYLIVSNSSISSGPSTRQRAPDAALRHNRQVTAQKSYAAASMAAELESYGVDASVANNWAQDKLRRAEAEANAILLENTDDDYDEGDSYSSGAHLEHHALHTEKVEDLFFMLFQLFWQDSAGLPCAATADDLTRFQNAGCDPTARRCRDACERLNELLQKVNQSALLEYKTLRFIRLWIQNSNIPAQRPYLEAVDAAQQALEERVQLAADYAAAAGLPFRLQAVL